MSDLPCIEIEPALAARATVRHHGSRDPMVAEELGHQAHSTLLAMGYQAQYRAYRMEHNVCAEQIPDISRWLQRVLSAA
ncbi:MAG: hypothetical protein WAR81_14610 [Pseudomonadales bacterium]